MAGVEEGVGDGVEEEEMAVVSSVARRDTRVLIVPRVGGERSWEETGEESLAATCSWISCKSRGVTICVPN